METILLLKNYKYIEAFYPEVQNTTIPGAVAILSKANNAILESVMNFLPANLRIGLYSKYRKWRIS